MAGVQLAQSNPSSRNAALKAARWISLCMSTSTPSHSMISNFAGEGFELVAPSVLFSAAVVCCPRRPKSACAVPTPHALELRSATLGRRPHLALVFTATTRTAPALLGACGAMPKRSVRTRRFRAARGRAGGACHDGARIDHPRSIICIEHLRSGSEEARHRGGRSVVQLSLAALHTLTTVGA
jgi:hypothetical protein